MKKKRILISTAVAYLSGVCICLSMNVTGPMLNDIMEHYSIPLSSGGMMSFLQNVGGIVAVLLFSNLINRSNKALAFVPPLMMLGIAALLIGAKPSYWIFMVLYAVLGMGATMGDVVGNALIPVLQYENKARALSLLHGFAGLGAIVIAFVSGSILDSGIAWNIVYIIVGIAFTTVAVINAVNYAASRKYIKDLVTPKEEVKQKGAIGDFIKDKRIWISVLVQLFFGACQITTVVWTSQYCRDVFGASALMSNMTLVAYWSGTALIRMAFGLTKLGQLNIRKVTIVGGISSGLVMVVGMLCNNYYALIAAIVVFGMLSAPILPLGVSLTNNYYKEHSGLVSSFLMLGLYGGFTLAPLLAGIFADAFGMNAIIILIAVTAILSGVAGVFYEKE